MNRKLTFVSILVILVLAITACSAGTAFTNLLNRNPTGQAVSTPLPVQPTSPANSSGPAIAPPNPPVAASSSAIAAMEGVLQQIYAQVNPSVVNIQVVSQAPRSIPGNPFGNQGNPGAFIQQALGSGFVWDKQGHIVTNNHVVDGATTVNVTFSDGLTVAAKVIGTDVNSDLAVIQVDVPADRLQPITLADSTQVKVGQLAIAIGNPYGLEGSMSVGIISGLQRSLPVSNNNSGFQSGLNYTIPDILQTDAPINPGNSGGVLVDDQGHVMGVTAAIESQSGSNSGIGFVIPSELVNKVIPALILNGHYDHPWIGIAGTTMKPELAQPMGLNSDQRGVLVVEVTPGSPAAKAGIQGSTKPVTINGQQGAVGGDVIVAIDGHEIKTFDDMVTYLSRSTNVGQKITLNLLRSGKNMTVDVTLEARPSDQAAITPPQSSQVPRNPINPQNPQVTNGAYLGISGFDLVPEIIQAMKLPSNQQGVLVEQVQPGSPAARAGLKAGTQSLTINGQDIFIGGDVITAIDGQSVSGLKDLRNILSQYQADQQATLDVLRDGKTSQVKVTLGSIPASLP
ncbi:MAG: PDZ domain-containing protein [Anaerolineaceae bacterium]|nr:PDZ domain-containing protein [Anaerolineaceae bacterium]